MPQLKHVRHALTANPFPLKITTELTLRVTVEHADGTSNSNAETITIPACCSEPGALSVQLEHARCAVIRALNLKP